MTSPYRDSTGKLEVIVQELEAENKRLKAANQALFDKLNARSPRPCIECKSSRDSGSLRKCFGMPGVRNSSGRDWSYCDHVRNHSLPCDYFVDWK